MARSADGRGEGYYRTMLRKLRWPPEGIPVCPSCRSYGTAVPAERSRRDRMRCYRCGFRFTYRTGTVMEGSRLPASVWYHALRCMVRNMEHGRETSINALVQRTGVSRETAIALRDRIRKHLSRRPLPTRYHPDLT
jgi:transposase-like protein